MPILTLVIPQLKSDGHKWTLEGRATARQCQISRGLLPVLAAPSPSGELPVDVLFGGLCDKIAMQDPQAAACALSRQGVSSVESNAQRCQPTAACAAYALVGDMIPAKKSFRSWGVLPYLLAAPM